MLNHATSLANRKAFSLTDVAENDGEEDESVGGADEDDAQVHPEVEDLEDLGPDSIVKISA